MQSRNELIDRTVNQIFGLYKLHGDNDYGENVTQLMHMVQAAKHAQSENAGDELILAAFFHDLGHFLENGDDMESYGKHHHDLLGGIYLRNLGFPERMSKLVSRHVDAKRYLTYKNPGYYDQLSDASKITLSHQGGAMNEQEAEAFENEPLFSLYIKIRTWDDLAKDVHEVTEPAYVEELRKKTMDYLMLNLEQR